MGAGLIPAFPAAGYDSSEILQQQHLSPIKEDPLREIATHSENVEAKEPEEGEDAVKVLSQSPNSGFTPSIHSRL